MMSLNARTVTVKIKRGELCDLLMACTAIDCNTEEENTKWADLHDKLKKIIDEFDETHAND